MTEQQELLDQVQAAFDSTISKALQQFRNLMAVEIDAAIGARLAEIKAKTLAESAAADRLSAAEGRIETLATNLRHVGVWDSSSNYKRQNQVTFDGSTWVAQRATLGEVPGHDDGADRAWVLATKRGRNGKDAPGVAR